MGKSLYVYQIEFVAEYIKQGLLAPGESGVTLEHTLGNVLVLEAWLKQVKNNEFEIDNVNSHDR